VYQGRPVHAEPLIRDVTDADAEAIFDLVTLCDIAEVGEPDHALDDVRPVLDEDFRGWVIEDGDGLAGYANVHRQPEEICVLADIVVRPGRTDLYVPLLDQVREAAPLLDKELPLQTFTDSKNVAKRRLLEAAGATVVRRFLRMVIRMPDEPAPVVPETPPGVAIRVLTDSEDDLRTVYDVVDVAFLDHFGHARSSFDEWRQRIERGSLKDRSLGWLATVDGAPAASLLAVERTYGGYIDTLGTLREWRGRGLGRALMLTSFAEFHARGARKITLGVDADNPTGALGLYTSVGMTQDFEGLLYQFP
jgi:ribosomal protein S18 acetylase RimI-like enzyme